MHFSIPELFWDSVLKEVPTWKGQSDSQRIHNLMTDNKPILKSFLIVRFLILIFVIDTLFLNNITYDDFSEGWEDGYCEGWKDVKGSFAICPIAPIAPIPPIGKDSYRGGYNMGFKAGMRAAYRN